MYIIINFLIRKLGRSNYSIDKSIDLLSLSIIICEKFAQLLRGSIYYIKFKKANGLIFIGKNCSIKYCHKISAGKTLIIGNNVQINALSERGIRFGNNVSIHSGSILDCTGCIRNIGQQLIIGNNVGFSANCYVQVRGKVEIGNNVIFGPGAKIFSENHNFTELSLFINEQGETRKGVKIMNGVWVGADAVILDGVTIGENAIIAAKTLVNKDVPSFSIVAGIPGKVIKYRLDPTEETSKIK